jgi:hypothetical protein
MAYAPKRAEGTFYRSTRTGSPRGTFGMAEGGGGRHDSGNSTPRREPGPVIPRIPRPRPASE